MAVYSEGATPVYNWGWTNHSPAFNDNAVEGYFDPGGTPEWNWDELSYDMSFVLFTDPTECVTCADYNSDGIVNLIDFSVFADNWPWTGSVGGYNNSDLNCDGKVNIEDLKTFANQWLSNCM